MVSHDAILRGLRADEAGPAPTILQRTDQNFLAALLADLEHGVDLSPHLARDVDANSLRKLYQPVHRTFHVVMVEASCARPGAPRIDPQRIETAGIVIRRIAREERDSLEGWMQDGTSLRGWVPLLGKDEQELDPDPERRKARGSTGNAEIDRRLSLIRQTRPGLGEATSPLFVAPPEVCEAAGRTVLYGIVPLTSDEVSEVPSEPPRLDSSSIASHLSELLTGRVTRTSESAAYQWLGTRLAPDPGAAEGEEGERLRRLLLCVRQLSLELDAFGSGASSRRLLALLDQVALPFEDDTTRPAGALLRDVAEALLEGRGSGVTMPIEWPAFPQSLREAIVDEVGTTLSERGADLGPARTPRYGVEGRYFVLQAFARVKRDDGCPPDLVWSPPSEPFSIAAWYETGDVPPVPIALPDPSGLADLKPNVAFALPESLMNKLKHTSLDGLLNGESGSEDGPGLGIAWLCHFSIPIITLCAFIVLNIFLQLLNIIFFWLPFVKICIPIPKPAAPSPPSPGG